MHYKRLPMTISYWQRNAHLPMRATYSATTSRRQSQGTSRKPLAKLRIKYSRAEPERLAIADANQFQFTPAQIQRDIQELRRLGSLDALIVDHNNKQNDSGLNESRVQTHLGDEEQFPKILDIVQNEAIADTDPAFVISARTASFRDLQRRLR